MEKELMVFEVNGQVLTDSRYVAETVGKAHKELLAMIEGQTDKDGKVKHVGFIKVISESGVLRSQDFFIESSYKAEGNNRTYKCYLVTKKGCEMIAHKMQGEKGILFTAKYVTQFEALEKAWVDNRIQGKATRLEISTAVNEAFSDSKNLHWKHKHFTDLGYKVVLGVNCKEFKEERGLDKNANIRDYMTAEELKKVADVENEMAVLVGFGMEYQEIKERLTKKYTKQALIK